MLTAKRILIMGLPGSGKTTLANELHELILSLGLQSYWINENQLRIDYPNVTNDLIDSLISNNSKVNYIVADFEAQTSRERRSFYPQYLIWMNTIPEEDYQFINHGFEPPFKYNICVTTKDAPKWARKIFLHILSLGSNQ